MQRRAPRMPEFCIWQPPNVICYTVTSLPFERDVTCNLLIEKPTDWVADSLYISLKHSVKSLREHILHWRLVSSWCVQLTYCSRTDHVCSQIYIRTCLHIYINLRTFTYIYIPRPHTEHGWWTGSISCYFIIESQIIFIKWIHVDIGESSRHRQHNANKCKLHVVMYVINQYLNIHIFTHIII